MRGRKAVLLIRVYANGERTVRVLSRRLPDIQADTTEDNPPEPQRKYPDTEADISEHAPIKVTLANTPLKAETLLKKMKYTTGQVGFDTEVAGPLLRGQDFVNITHSVLLGLSVAFEDERCYYVPMRHKGNNASFFHFHHIAEALQSLARTGQLWAHNAKFDHQVMIRAGYPLDGMNDSMIAAWLLTGKNRGIGLKELAESILKRRSPPYDPSISHKTGDETKVYAGHDALNTLQLGLHFRPQLEERGLMGWFKEECRFTHSLAEMKLGGMRIDRRELRGVRAEATLEMGRVLREWEHLASDIKITSSTQLQGLFEDGTWTAHGLTPGGKLSTSGTAMKWNVLNAQTGAGRKLAQLRLDFQEVAKIVSTYTDGLIEESLQWADKKLHPDLFHFGTVTGRLSSANPNIQNQPAHGQWAKKIKACFIPDPGMEFTSADYSQVELRYFADYCGGELLRVLCAGEDPHSKTAEAMGTDRDGGKTVNFGFLLYGGAPEKLAREVLKCSVAEASERIAALHRAYPEVEPWRQRIIQQADASSSGCPFVHTLAGRVRHIPELNPEWMRIHLPEEYTRLVKKYHATCRMRGRDPHPNGHTFSIRSRGERLVVNYLIQGGARDLLVLGMNNFVQHDDRTDDMEIVTTVHDEVLIQHLIGHGEDARHALKESLEAAGPMLGLKVPIIAEPVTGSNWAEVK